MVTDGRNKGSAAKKSQVRMGGRGVIYKKKKRTIWLAPVHW